MRRPLVILGLILFLGIVGVTIYLLFFRPSVSVAPGPSTGTSFPGSGTGSLGQSGAPSGTGPGSNASSTSPITVSAKLVQITPGPVVPGVSVIAVPPKTASSSAQAMVTYIMRESGNVFRYDTQAKTSTRVNNRTVPGIESAQWLPDASWAYGRYLSGKDNTVVNTYALPATQGVQGFFLNQNIADLAVSSTTLLVTASSDTGSTLSLLHTDGTNPVTAVSTPLSQVRASFAGKDKYLIYPKPTGTIPGSAYIVSKTGRYTRVAGPYAGLSALASPSGKWVLVSYVSDHDLKTALVVASSTQAIALPVGTLTDKCVWTADERSLYCAVPGGTLPDGEYPDDWYQGAVSFSDRIWRVDVANRYAEMVLDFSTETKQSLDGISLSVDASKTFLVFTNKTDGSLWSVHL